jgi:hypothetical protein
MGDINAEIVPNWFGSVNRQCTTSMPRMTFRKCGGMRAAGMSPEKLKPCETENLNGYPTSFSEFQDFSFSALYLFR